MIGELQSKYLITVKADTAQAKAAIKDLSATEQKAARERVEAQERHNASLERSNQKFALYAAGAAAGYAIITSSVKKYEQHLVSLGSKGEAELKRLRDTTGTLTKAQDNLQIAIAKVALEAAPAAKALADMANALALIVGGIGAVVEKAKDLPGAGAVGWLAGNAWRVAAPAANLYDLGSRVLSTGGTDPNDPFYRSDALDAALNRYVDRSVPGSGYASPQEQYNNRKEIEAIQARVDSVIRKAEKAGRRAGRRARRGRGGGGTTAVDPYADASVDIFGQIAATSGYSSGRYSQEDLDLLGLGEPGRDTSQDDRLKEMSQGLGLIADDATRLSGELAKLMETLPSRQESILHQIFGTPNDIDAQAEAIGYAAQSVTVLADASSAAMQAWISGSGSLADVFRKQVADGLGAIAGDLAGKATRHLVEAAAHAVLGSPKAAQHLGAAAIYGGGAFALGAAAKAIHPGAKVHGGGAKAGNSYAQAGGIGSTRGGDRENRTVNVVIGDGFADNSPRYTARRTRRALELANRYADYGGSTPG